MVNCTWSFRENYQLIKHRGSDPFIAMLILVLWPFKREKKIGFQYWVRVCAAPMHQHRWWETETKTKFSQIHMGKYRSTLMNILLVYN